MRVYLGTITGFQVTQLFDLRIRIPETVTTQRPLEAAARLTQSPAVRYPHWTAAGSLSRRTPTWYGDWSAPTRVGAEFVFIGGVGVVLEFSTQRQRQGFCKGDFVLYKRAVKRIGALERDQRERWFLPKRLYPAGIPAPKPDRYGGRDSDGAGSRYSDCGPVVTRSRGARSQSELHALLGGELDM